MHPPHKPTLVPPTTKSAMEIWKRKISIGEMETRTTGHIQDLKVATPHFVPRSSHHIYMHIHCKYIMNYICIPDIGVWGSKLFHFEFVRLRKLTAPVRPNPLQHSSDPLGYSTMPYANASESDVKEHLANGFATIEQMLNDQSEKIEALTSKMLEHKKETNEKLNRLSLNLEEIKSALHDLEFADNGFECVGIDKGDLEFEERDTLVYIFPKGTKFHKIGSGSCWQKMHAQNIELSVPKKLAVALQRKPCTKCFPAEKVGGTSKSSA